MQQMLVAISPSSVILKSQFADASHVSAIAQFGGVFVHDEDVHEITVFW